MALDDFSKGYYEKRRAMMGRAPVQDSGDVMRKVNKQVHQAERSRPVLEQAAAEMQTEGRDRSIGERIGKTVSGAAKSYLSSLTNAGGDAARTQGGLWRDFTRDSVREWQQEIDRWERDLSAWRADGSLTREEEEDLTGMIQANREKIATYTMAQEGRRGSAEAARGLADEIALSGARDIDQAKEGLGAAGQFAVDAGTGLVHLAGDIGLGAMTGGAAAIPLAVRSYGGSSQKARLEGANDDRAALYGLTSAAMEVATGMLGNVGRINSKFFGGGAVDDVVEGMVRALERKGGGKVSRALLNRAGTAAAGFVTEGAEEALSAIIDPFLRRAIYSDDPLDAGEILGGALYDFAVGGAVGGIAGGIGGTDTTRDLRSAERNADAAIDRAYDAMGSAGPWSPAAAEAVREANGLLEQAARAAAETSGVSGKAADRILRDESALEQLRQETGLELSDNMTQSERRAAVKQAASRLVTSLDAQGAAQSQMQADTQAVAGKRGPAYEERRADGDIGPYGTENRTAGGEKQTAAKRAYDAKRVRDGAAQGTQMSPELAPKIGEAEVAGNIMQVRRAASALGESGNRMLVEAYDMETARKYSPQDVVESFYQVYQAASQGKTLSQTAAAQAGKLPGHIRMAAELAGQSDAQRAAQAKYFGEKAGLVKDQSWRKAHLSSQNTRRLDALGKALGVEVRFADRIEGPDGAAANARYSNGTIEISLEADDPVMTAAIHESIHRLRETDGAAYGALADFILDHMSEQAVDLGMESRSRLYGTADNAVLSEELVADAFGRMMDGAFLDQFVVDNRSAAEKLLDILRDMVNAVARVLKGQNITLTEGQKAAFGELEGELRGMERAMQKALAAAKQAQTLPAGVDGDTMGATKHSLKEGGEDGRKEAERGAEGAIQQDHAGGSSGNGQNRTSDGKILGILSLQRMSQGQQPVHSWAEDGLIVPEPGSVADSEAHVIQDEYDLPVFVVKSDIFDQNHATAPAFSAEGQVFLREDLPEIGRKDIGAHEAGHVMKQLGYEPYLNFIRDTPDLINTGTNTARKLLEFAASHTSVDLFSMNNEDVLDLYDEINNMVYGAIHAGRSEILEFVRPAFFDFDAYAAELTQIHEQFKRERGGTQTRELRKENGSAGLSQEELRAVQNIGRKSVNDFTAENIKATEFFARQYWEEMGAKSPFFRAWFGDWRANDHTPVERAAELGDARGKVHNEDTGWDINVSGKVFNETRAHTGPANVNARQYLLHLNDIIKKAVLLDSYTMTEGKAKSANSLLMHSMYTVADIGKGPELLKLYVEEMNDPNSKNTTKRAYQLQNIEHQQLNAKGSGRSPSPVISTADIRSVADLFAAVKRLDKNFNPKPASAVVDEAGRPLTVYHGTNRDFWTFDPALGAYWFSQAEDYAESMAEERSGDRIMGAYLDMKNPLRATLLSGEFTDPQAEAPYIRKAKAEGYDGVIFEADTGNPLEADTFYVVFRPEQIKSATDNIGTFDRGDPDTRYSKSDRELLDEYVERYGQIPKGERPTREVRVPRKTAEDKKVSQTVRTILEAGATPEELVPNLEKLTADGTFSYDVYTDKQAIQEAADRIGGTNGVGWEEAQREWFRAMEHGEASKKNTVMGWTLYDNAANSGDTGLAIDILKQMVVSQRSAAQALQATRVMKKLSPAGQLYGVQRSVNSLQNELNQRYGKKNGPTLKIDRELAEELMEARDQAERDKILKEIYRDIGRQLPSRFVDKWNAWRYLAMLGNVRTHVRNVAGNAGFLPVAAVKDLTATAIEAAVSRVSGGKLNRSKALVGAGKGDRALLKAAWGDYANVQDAAMSGRKYDDLSNANQYIEEGRVIFKTKALEQIRRANSRLLEGEDQLFSKPHYAYAMAQYCKANGITAEQIAAGKGLDRAREYAVLEAQKATYRDTNAFSYLISRRFREQGEYKNAAHAANMLADGVLPFRKTPANILVRGVEYSPLGLLTGLKQALWDVRQGTKTGAEAIDSISAGLTGTGLMALGIYLAAEGLIRGHGSDDDKEKQFEELMGHQAYALELPDGTSVTLDWLAPEALPFFVGVNLWEQTGKGKEQATLADLLSATATVTEPLLEMSCLQSLNAVFDAVGYARDEGMDGLTKALASAATSFLTQAQPTLLGQVERTLEDKRYTTFLEQDGFLTGDMQYALGKASARVPGWDFQQIPYIDAWGRTEGTGTAGARSFNNFLNPAYTASVNESEMEQELLRLYQATGMASVLPRRAERSFPVNEEEKHLNAREYVKYAREKGQTAYTILEELTRSEPYRTMNDEERAETVSKAYAYANAWAKTRVSDYEPEDWTRKAIEVCRDTGMKPAVYVPLYLEQGSVQSLKDKNGETIDNSAGLLKMELVYRQKGLNDKQRQALFKAFGVGKSVMHLNKAAVTEKLARMRKQAG